jgi:ATP-dependent DNA helicase RecG
MKKEIALGRQVYVVFPLIEESEKIDFENLQEGFQRISEAFPAEKFHFGSNKKSSPDPDMKKITISPLKYKPASKVIKIIKNEPKE